MKKTEKKQAVRTTPKGVWEASRPEHSTKEPNPALSKTTDLQGNGYPQNNSQH